LGKHSFIKDALEKPLKRLSEDYRECNRFFLAFIYTIFTHRAWKGSRRLIMGVYI